MKTHNHLQREQGPDRTNDQTSHNLSLLSYEWQNARIREELDRLYERKEELLAEMNASPTRPASPELAREFDEIVAKEARLVIEYEDLRLSYEKEDAREPGAKEPNIEAPDTGREEDIDDDYLEPEIDMEEFEELRRSWEEDRELDHEEERDI